VSLSNHTIHVVQGVDFDFNPFLYTIHVVQGFDFDFNPFLYTIKARFILKFNKKLMKNPKNVS
jgi:hypothetical protein